MSTPETSDNEMTPPTPNSIAWNELITPDPAAAVSFYSELFGWTTETMPMPQGDYTMFKIGGSAFGGVMAPMQPGTPPNWLNYVSVTDADASAAKAVSLGAKICMGPMDIAEVGRIAILSDPQGAMFGLHQMK